jgi:hypothetical protein
MSRETTQSRYKFTCDYCRRTAHETLTDGGHSTPADLPPGWVAVLREGDWTAADFCSDKCAALSLTDPVNEARHNQTQPRPQDQIDRLVMKHRLTREDPAVRG